MSYGPASALQTAVYEKLRNDVGLTDYVGTHVYDAVPSGQAPPLFVQIGVEDVKDNSDATALGSLHDMTVSVVSEASGFFQVKEVAGAVSDALLNNGLTLSRGRLVSIRFLRARARHAGTGDARRVDLKFRLQLEDTI
ncbi:MAG: DUF3168 domain-containing protein [Pseudoruegeria sp.]